MINKFFKYLEPIILGYDGQVSIRRLLALCFSIDFINNMNFIVHEWEIGKSYSDVAMVVGLEAGLIAALLSLTTYSTSIKQKQDESI